MQQAVADFPLQELLVEECATAELDVVEQNLPFVQDLVLLELTVAAD